MPDFKIIIPSKPRVVLEEDNKGVFEIDGLYPGYGHTLGNSLRRIILSSLPGASVTSIKIEGVSHEFQTIDGIKEDAIKMILHLKKTRFKIVTGKVNLNIEMKVEKGLGFIPKEVLQKEKVDVGTIAVDAIFTPIRRVSYEVENMRVGDKTNHNRLRIFIETDGTLSPREALSQSIAVMITQLKAIIDFKEPEEEITTSKKTTKDEEKDLKKEKDGDDFTDVLKTRTDSLDLSTRTLNALSAANIRTLGGLARKKHEDLLEVEGIGEKGITEIRKILGKFGLTLKE